MSNGYRLIDHTADFGLHIHADDAATLFETAAMALFDMIAEPRAEAAENIRVMEISGGDWADLMVNWLRELLYLWNGEAQLVSRVAMEKIEAYRLRATVFSVNFDPRRHEVRNEIKAVTYHQIAAGPCEAGWQARVIFDI